MFFVSNFEAEILIIPSQFVLYIQHLAIQSHSREAVEEAVNAASWVSQIAELAPLTQNPIVKLDECNELGRK